MPLPNFTGRTPVSGNLQPIQPAAMKHSIALKIFGLSVSLLVLMLVVAILNSFKVIKLGEDVEEIASVSLPVSHHAALLNESGLRRRIAFERLYREYGTASPDSATVADASVNFKKFTTQVYTYIDSLRNDLDYLPEVEKESENLIKARELISMIESTFTHQTEIAETILENRQKNRLEENPDLMAINIDIQRVLQDKRSELQSVAMEITDYSAGLAKQTVKALLWSSLIISLLAIVVGLWGAYILSIRLASPLKKLLTSTQAVSGGNLTVHIDGLPDDEIGRLGASMNEMIRELQRKAQLQEMISTYIDPRIVEKIILAGRSEMLAGQRQEMTILFSDLADFSSLSEKLSPAALVKLINRYFTVMSECIRAEQGIIDKYIGDAIMAYWGPPFISEEEQAAAACRAALRQRDAMAKLRNELPELLGLRRDVPELHLRIGLASGEVVVGNIGSDTARSYTVMGDVVNLASRLESVNKEYGTTILISENTMRMADRVVECREVDRIIVKGTSEPVQIHELIATSGYLSEEWEQRRTRYGQALDAYRRQDWSTARLIFKEVADKFSDRPAATFLNRLESIGNAPPMADWDGVWKMTSK